MNILFLSTWYPNPPDNGSKIRVYNLLRSLAQEHTVTLISFAFDTARPEVPREIEAMCQDVQVLQINPFVHNQANALRTFASTRPMASRPIPAMKVVVDEVLQSDKFDAVIASTEMTASYALGAQPSTVKILEIHNSMSLWMQERFKNASSQVDRLRFWLSWQKRCRHEANFYPHFDLVTVVSEKDRAAAMVTVGNGGPQIETVSNGVDCEYNRPGIAQSLPYSLIYNGSLTYTANYDAMRWFLNEIYPRIKDKMPSVSMVITGSTEGVDLSALALDETVTLTGFVEDIRVPVAEAAVCVAPIRFGGGTRLKILEAMALGTPVIATSKGAEGLNVSDGEHLLLEDDPESFATSTAVLLKNPDLSLDLTSNARKLVENEYDWLVIGQRFVKLIERTIGQ